jgi:energy-coupling factor transporter ATP-binding protein EcfA2
MTADAQESAWNLRPLIRGVRVPGSGEEMGLAQPRGPTGPGAINVLCGINATGKTHILRGIKAFLTRLKDDGVDSSGVQVTLTRELSATVSPPRVLSFINTAITKAKSGRSDLGIDKRGLDMPGDVTNYRVPMLEFFRRELMRRFTDAPILPEDWAEDAARRDTMARRLRADTVYSADPGDRFIAGIESVLNAQIYYRRAQKAQLELVKRTVDGVLQVYDKWSEGERAAFLVTGMVLLERPDIVLVDELENHLHPGLMSALLVFLRRNVPQTLITTHHPHVIFSEWVDRVIYIDTHRAARGADRPDTLPYTTAPPPTPRRQITPLISDFDKLSSAYALFHQQDRRLLEQAELVRATTTIRIAEALQAPSTAEEAVVESLGLDVATIHLLRAIRDKLPRGDRALRVLDIGGRVCREAVEPTKLGPWSPPASVAWWAWEPSPDRRMDLRRAADTLPQIHVVDDLSLVSPGDCDVALMANVLHGLPLSEAGDLLTVIYDKVLTSGGTLMIVETYPLLVPEKFSIGYPAFILLKLLDELGLQRSEHHMSIGGNRAYLIVCRADVAIAGFRENAARAFALAWQNILRDAVNQYASLEEIRDMEAYRSNLSHLTTIASITASFHGQWATPSAAAR